MISKERHNRRVPRNIYSEASPYVNQANGGGENPDYFLTNSFTAGEHPTRHLSEEGKIVYINAVGELISTIPHEKKKLRLAFSIWSNSLGICQATCSNPPTHKFLFLRKANDIFGFTPNNQHLCVAIAFDFLVTVEKVLGDASTYIPIVTASLNGNAQWSLYIYHAFTLLKGDIEGCKLPPELLAQWRKEQSFAHQREKRVVFAATMSAGKSTLINAIVGHKINEVRATACTSRVHYIHNKLHDGGAMARFDGDKYVYTNDYHLLCSEVVEAASLNFSSNLRGERICLIDTPGVNFSGDSSHRDITHSIIGSNDFDLLVVVLNSLQLAICDECNFTEYISRTCKHKVIFALNKLDCFNPEDGDSIEDAMLYARQMTEECGIKNPTIVPVSGMAAFLIRQQRKQVSALTESDKHTLRWIRQLTETGYFNLPRHAGLDIADEDGDKLLWQTGVPLLENVIIDNLKQGHLK